MTLAPISAVVLSASSLLQGCALRAPSSAQAAGSWTWGPDRVSQAYLTRVLAFQGEWDAARATDGDPALVVERHVPSFLPLAEDGDPDAKRWFLEYADWERTAEDPARSERLLTFLSELLRDHGDGWRAETLGYPMAEAWWWLPTERDALLAILDEYMARSDRVASRVVIARHLGGALFDFPRGPQDQDRALSLVRFVAEHGRDEADLCWARSTAEILAWQRIGSPAPEIVGRSVDEEELRLSDTRGRVVVLEFWGFW